jgi:uncharacterized oxidoreductase
MVKQFLPHLKQKPTAAIVNVSSGLAFVPLAIAPVYSATKAAIHSFTQSLRVQLKNTHVYEIRPGLANALKLMSRVAPQFIFKQLSKSADNMLARMKGAAGTPVQ